MRKLYHWIFMAGLTGLVACQSPTPVNTTERAVPTAVRQPVADKRLICDARFNAAVNIVNLNHVTTAGGMLSVQFEVQNTTARPVRFSYRFEWFDAAGMLLDTPASGWLSRQIEGGESLFIAGVAPTTAAKDFRIKLMKGHTE